MKILNYEKQHVKARIFLHRLRAVEENAVMYFAEPEGFLPLCGAYVPTENPGYCPSLSRLPM